MFKLIKYFLYGKNKEKEKYILVLIHRPGEIVVKKSYERNGKLYVKPYYGLDDVYILNDDGTVSGGSINCIWTYY